MVSNACGARSVLADARPPAPNAVYPAAIELLRPAVRVIMSATADCVKSCWRLGSSPDCTSPHDVAGNEMTSTRRTAFDCC